MGWQQKRKPVATTPGSVLCTVALPERCVMDELCSNADDDGHGQPVCLSNQLCQRCQQNKTRQDLCAKITAILADGATASGEGVAGGSPLVAAWC